MSDIRKHRLEKLVYSFPFESKLADGDSLQAGTESLKVLSWNAGTGAWDDVTSEFGAPDPTVSGTDVVFTLHKATGEQQDGGKYSVLCEVDTANGEELVYEVERGSVRRVPILTVSEDGDPAAP